MYIKHGVGHLHIKIYPLLTFATSFISGVTQYYYSTSHLYHYGENIIPITILNATDFTTQNNAHGGLYYNQYPEPINWTYTDFATGEEIDISGPEIDVDVSAGYTHCYCGDFSRKCVKIFDTGIKIELDSASFPPFAGPLDFNMKYIHGDFKHLCQYLDMVQRNSSPDFKIENTNLFFNLSFNNKHSFKTFRQIIINNSPNVIGNIYDILSDDKGALASGIYGDDHYKYHTSPRTFAKWSFHHCGVHGYPIWRSIDEYSQPDDYNFNTIPSIIEYYACPNASPTDFDNLLKAIVEQAAYAGPAWIGVSKRTSFVGPCYFGTGISFAHTDQRIGVTNAHPICYSYDTTKTVVTLGTDHWYIDPIIKISNRRTSASDVYVNILREAGWTVTEVDDSLETGIYANTDYWNSPRFGS